ncbi:GntR family transcriptional regulator [Streptomyces sp. Wb2n-11]|uniref:GntR family transcriptional regulator n=1 Tax=Streptomyces sp. Wb2n-11 TaxID=1030533 RepID=UPI000AD445E1|nr:GntR family transcriptional regulator [Streptomyces sp. Wb2n-11]
MDAVNGVGSQSAEATYKQLRSELDALWRIGNRYDYTSNDVEAVRQLVEPWLPIAKARLEAATGSPSDQARWQSLVAAVERPSDEVEPKFTTVSTPARGLVRALMDLMEATRPGPSAREITDRLRAAINDGTHPPGSMLSRMRITAEAGLTPASAERVELALQDLAAMGLVTVLPSKRIRVATPVRAT